MMEDEGDLSGKKALKSAKLYAQEAMALAVIFGFKKPNSAFVVLGGAVLG